MKNIETQVCIIGAGATGAGIFRDLSLRGIPSVLIEKNDVSTGTSGRNHGLLHSGARYAVKDKESAIECIQENQILKKIGRYVTEDTGGFFVALDDHDVEYADEFSIGCKQTGIKTEELSVSLVLKEEPNLNPKTKRVFRVPDGSVDPFRLVTVNVEDAKLHGGVFFNYTEVISSQKKKNQIDTITVYNKIKDEKFKIKADYFINASGPWAGLVANRLHTEMKMAPSMGVMVILDHRMINTVINRMRLPADGDIIVPGETVSIIGTTSRKVDESELDNLIAQPEEVYQMIHDASIMVPAFGRARMLRYYSGARPLPDFGDTKGRDVSRNFLIKDHSKEEKDKFKIENVFSMVGGKLMTYRLMAEKMTDIIASKINNTSKCVTAEQELPYQHKRKPSKIPKLLRKNYGIVTGYQRQGDLFLKKLKPLEDVHLVCECEMVTDAELKTVAESGDIHNISDLRRRTRIGMGPCQGSLCGLRTMESDIFKDDNAIQKNELLETFVQERWKGIKEVMWGDTLRMEEFSMWLYSEIWGWE